ncbi:GIY-YIG nuclease family protein [Tolumonas lignilytica]|uniref:GIY-YIG nuclease family protein n=1 Tax=Tolumonas lignilytica TaxID=1283284 RepID=UPI0004AC7041|nr:GIY-YIG nuclease family protein [Tolumonas lignilytica]
MSEELLPVEDKKLKKYYVYELVDPMTNEVFYVGKGQEYRVEQHEIEAKNEEANSKKIKKIHDITQQGYEVIKRIIGRFDEENEAFSVEATLIHWVYGKNNLTNIAGGHGCDSIRPYGDNSIIEGIDIPPRERSNNGEYSNVEKNKIIENDIENFMVNVKNELERKLNLEFSEIRIDQSRFTEIYHEINGLKITVFSNNSKTRKLKLEVRPLTSKKEHVKNVINLCEKQSVIKIKNAGKYALIPSQKPTQDIDDICLYFNVVKEIIINIS